MGACCSVNESAKGEGHTKHGPENAKCEDDKVQRKNLETKSNVPEIATKPPRAIPFAVMRNCHEVIRAAISECDTALEDNNHHVLTQGFASLTRCIETHAKMEENGSFPLVGDYFGGAHTKAGLAELHVTDEKLTKELTKALYDGDMEEAKIKYKAWKEHHLLHLKKEEEVMMPLVPKFAKATMKGDSIKMGEVFNKHILTPNFDDAVWFAGYCCWMLSRHGTQKQDGFTAMRVFAHGLQYGSTPEQWEQILPEIKSKIPAQQYERLVKTCQIESKGKATGSFTLELKASASEASKPSAAAAPSDKKMPKAIPFAVMRNCHEVIRNVIKECDKAADKEDVKELSTLFEELTRCIHTHVAFEEKGFFPLVGGYFDDVHKKELGDIHEEDEKLTTVLKEALKGEDTSAALNAYKAWKDYHLSHLKKEEEVMMPLVPKFAKATMKGDSIKMGEVFNKHILTPNFDDAVWFAGYCCGVLSKCGSQKQDGFTAMRVFAHGLQYGSSPEQWKMMLPEIKTKIPAEHYERLVKECDIEAPGKAIGSFSLQLKV